MLLYCFLAVRVQSPCISSQSRIGLLYLIIVNEREDIEMKIYDDRKENLRVQTHEIDDKSSLYKYITYFTDYIELINHKYKSFTLQDATLKHNKLIKKYL